MGKLKVLSSREYQREQLKPIWHTGPGGMSQSSPPPGVLSRDASWEAVFSGQDPVHQRQKVYTLHTRLSRECVRRSWRWWQEEAQLLGCVTPSAVHHCWFGTLSPWESSEEL